MNHDEQEKAIRPSPETPQVRTRTSLIAFFRLIWLASLAMISVGALAAETPQMVGKFVRSDGVVVSAIERDLDGVVGFTGYTCWFELPDGTKIYPPEHPYGKAGSCVVRTSRTGADVYSFPIPSWTFPVANSILHFDGHQFEHVETPWKYWASPVVHTAHYFLGYSIAVLVFTPCLFIGDRLIRSAPWRGYWKWLRVFLILLGVGIAYIYGVFLSLFGPLALWVSLALLAIWAVLYWWTRKRIWWAARAS